MLCVDKTCLQHFLRTLLQVTYDWKWRICSFFRTRSPTPLPTLNAKSDELGAHSTRISTRTRNVFFNWSWRWHATCDHQKGQKVFCQKVFCKERLVHQRSPGWTRFDQVVQRQCIPVAYHRQGLYEPPTDKVLWGQTKTLGVTRAVNSHALSMSPTPGHYFSHVHAKHVKSPAWMRNIFFFFACHFFLKLKPIHNLTDAKRTAKYYFFHVLVPHAN